MGGHWLEGRRYHVTGMGQSQEPESCNLYFCSYKTTPLCRLYVSGKYTIPYPGLSVCSLYDHVGISQSKLKSWVALFIHNSIASSSFLLTQWSVYVIIITTLTSSSSLRHFLSFPIPSHSNDKSVIYRHHHVGPSTFTSSPTLVSISKDCQ